jgi:hypothetical protein
VSWEATSAVIAKSKQKGSARLMMLILADYADPCGFAYPGIGSIAENTKLSERNIQYLIGKAVASGELEVFLKAGPVIRKGRSKGQRTNLFRITFCRQPAPEHPYFEIKKWCKAFTTSSGESQRTNVVQESPQGGENQRRKVVQHVAPDPSGTTNEPSGSPAVDKSTSSRNGKTRKCTHPNCPPQFCRYSKEGFEAQDVENAGTVATRLAKEIVG